MGRGYFNGKYTPLSPKYMPEKFNQLHKATDYATGTFITTNRQPKNCNFKFNEDKHGPQEIITDAGETPKKLVDNRCHWNVFLMKIPTSFIG
jgi:hypothetical protein